MTAPLIIDPHRTVPATWSEEPLHKVASRQDSDQLTPGLMSLNSAGGYFVACPGCGALMGLPTHEQGQPQGWAEKGRFENGTLTLSPSVYHREPWGCGWHGWLEQNTFRGI